MDNCQPKLLVTSGSNYISQCRECKRIGVFYNNILEGFDLNLFLTFTEDVGKVKFKDYSVKLANEKPYIILKSFHEDIQFAFNKFEFEEFKDMLQQAKIMNDLDYILLH